MRKIQNLAVGLTLALIAATPSAVASTDLVYFGSAPPAGRPGPGGRPPQVNPHAPPNSIYAARFDEMTGQLTSLGQVTKLDRPTWIVANPEQPIIYSVNELGNFGAVQGQVVAYKVNPSNGGLAEINRVEAGGGGTTNLFLDQASQTIFTANYGTGQVSAVPIKPDGSLGALTSVVQDYGSGPSPRQQGPHAHAVGLDPSHQWLFVPDLGADRMFEYHFNDATRTLTPANPPYHQFAPGTGPRHLAFSADGRFIYMESELTAKVYVFALDAKTGKVSEVQQVSGVPAGFTGETSGAEIAVSRDGRFVYTSNRGDDTLEAYARKQSSGKLTEIQRLPAQGKNPWSFAIDPSAHWLLVTDQASNEVVVLKINPRTGKLSASGMSMPCLSPVSATFWVQ